MKYYATSHRPKKQPSVRTFRLLIAAMVALALTSSSTAHAVTANHTTTYQAVTPPKILVTAIQTGGCNKATSPCTESPDMEFVELYNTSEADLDVTGMKLTYLSASGNTATTMAVFNGSLKGRSYMLAAHEGHYDDIADVSFRSANASGVLAKSGGHIELTDASNTPIDRLGWGSATKALKRAATAPSNNQYLVRKNTDAGTLVHTANNAADFTATNSHDPQYGSYEITVAAIDEPGSTHIPANASTCRGVLISELLPNPSGTDTGREFIELHNSTDSPVALTGCSIKSSGSSKSFGLDGLVLSPDEYRALYDSTTGTVLPNANGGTVWLLDSAEELQSIAYPAAMADDTAWAYSGGTWDISFTPTPNSTNISTILKPCDDPSQSRNVDTGRCATTTESTTTSTGTTTASTTLTPCKPGQVRNPETNRCRLSNAAGTATTAAACKAGQIRNPETNRCKASTTQATKTACATGQERNPETNRCRKVLSSAGTTTNISDQDSASTGESSKFPTWLVISLIIMIITGYGLYEWRQEARSTVRRLISRLRIQRRKPFAFR